VSTTFVELFGIEVCKNSISLRHTIYSSFFCL